MGILDSKSSSSSTSNQLENDFNNINYGAEGSDYSSSLNFNLQGSNLGSVDVDGYKSGQSVHIGGGGGGAGGGAPIIAVETVDFGAVSQGIGLGGQSIESMLIQSELVFEALNSINENAFDFAADNQLVLSDSISQTFHQLGEVTEQVALSTQSESARSVNTIINALMFLSATVTVGFVAVRIFKVKKK